MSMSAVRLSHGGTGAPLSMKGRPMKALPLSRLLHENMAIVVTFVFSQQSLAELASRRFRGEWKYLWKFLYEIPATNAIRACLEIALLLRLIDDAEGIADYLKEMDEYHERTFGCVHRADGTTDKLLMRDLTNKIIHALDLEWDLSSPSAPMLICLAPPEQQAKFGWKRAEINIISLMAFAAGLMS